MLEDLDNFLKELGTGFCYIENEYKIKIGNTYNYIDILLFNYQFNCFVVVELKVTELRKEHIGQIEIYMNYIDKNKKRIGMSNTIGLIISKYKNEYIIEYSSDNRIKVTTYLIKENLILQIHKNFYQLMETLHHLIFLKLLQNLECQLDNR